MKAPGPASDEFAAARRAMVEDQIRKRGISARLASSKRCSAFRRQEFVPAEFRSEAYADKPLPIGEGQTISQPYMVAAMTEALELAGSERVLEIGTGSGYQAAVLSLLAREVISVENLTSLALDAQERLSDLGYTNVHVHNGDGSLGFADAAPYDAILVTAAAPEIPGMIADQLRRGRPPSDPSWKPGQPATGAGAKSGQRPEIARVVRLPVCAADRPLWLEPG